MSGAALLALLDDSTKVDLLAGLRRGWWFSLAAGLGTAALPLGLGEQATPAHNLAELVSEKSA